MLRREREVIQLGSSRLWEASGPPGLEAQGCYLLCMAESLTPPPPWECSYHVTLPFCPSRDGVCLPPLESGPSLQLVWPTERGKSDALLVPSPGFGNLAASV